MKRIVLSLAVLTATVAPGHSQWIVFGKNQTCSQLNYRCHVRKEPRNLCEAKFRDCLQTGTFWGQNGSTVFLRQH